MNNIFPVYYPERATLRKVIYNYNKYEDIDLAKMLSGEQSEILGINIPQIDGKPDPIYTQMLYVTLQEYMFAEIGFDVEEQFIQRFKAKWDSWSATYHKQLYILDKQSDGLFDRIITRNGTNNITDTGTEKRTVNDTVTGETTGSGDRTEYDVNTQHSSATNNSESTQNKTDTNERDLAHNTVTEQHVSETEVSPEKFSLYSRMVSITDEFRNKFQTLFMQVFTTM